MSTTVQAPSARADAMRATAARRRGARLPRILAAEIRSEFLKIARMPAYTIPVVAFPALFYGVFGLVFRSGRAGPAAAPMSAYLIATYGTFGVVGAALFGLGVGVATERGQGWLTVKRASPMPAIAYFVAKVAMSMMFGALIAVVLSLMGVVLGHVSMPAERWIALVLTLVLGAAPFCALGCAIGYLVGPNSAPAITNLLYLPMALASGLWIPIEFLPGAIRAIAPALPPYHLSRLALSAIGADTSSAAGHVAALAGFTVLFVAIAVAAYRRDEGKTYG
ncbi:MAG: ABC transporter permease [Gemmatimonadaceae bacterium]